MRLPVSSLLVALGLLTTLAPARAQTYEATVTCSSTPTGHIDWPADDPAWSFDFVRPLFSAGVDGSGLELLNAYYRGRLVFRRAHVPVLNVEYDSGCSCFRDWSDSEIGYATDGIRSGDESCFAEATPGAVQTTCDINMNGGTGGDAGSFLGVAVEEYLDPDPEGQDELVLTAHMEAGWYRYRMKWHLYEDGRIWPEYSFSAADAVCTGNTHRHHAYWRFDFDLDGDPLTSDLTDVVREINPAAGTTETLETETTRTWGDPADGVFWEVRDAVTDFGYEVVPSSADLQLPVDGFSQLDAAVLRYEPGTYDDGSPGCAIDPDGLGVDGESMADQDVVFWYRSGALHTGGNPWECDIAGPTLVPVGLKPPVPNEPGPGAMVGAYELERAYPNPFNPSTTVRFRVAEAQHVTLALYDALGRRVAVLWEGRAEAGRHESVRVDGAALPSGAYTVRLEGETVAGSTRLVLIK